MMIIIYTQDKTFIRDDADAARSVLLAAYGEKLGEDAYAIVKNSRTGVTCHRPYILRICPTEEEDFNRSLGLLVSYF